ncbi:MAG TPA: hypothetical protein VD967_03395 [Candidatus Paceibacterota bacterium]|nr:hypothetical protein [Candidatus Paceibacterota bacterium]
MRPILFVDFDGTICHGKFWRSLEPALRAGMQEIIFGPANRQMVGDWMLGKHSSEELNRKLADELPAEYDMLWKVFVEDCQNMPIDQSALEHIDRFRVRFTTILATDNMDCFNRFTVPALGLNRYFDSIVNSYDAGLRKNDEGGRLFLNLLRQHGSIASESVLIDNSKTTCEIFEKLGGRSLFVTPEQPISSWLDILEEDYAASSSK